LIPQTKRHYLVELIQSNIGGSKFRTAGQDNREQEPALHSVQETKNPPAASDQLRVQQRR